MSRLTILVFFLGAITSCFNSRSQFDPSDVEINFTFSVTQKDSLVISDQNLELECAKYLGLNRRLATKISYLHSNNNKKNQLYLVEAFGASDTFKLALIINAKSKKGAFLDLREVGLVETKAGDLYVYGVQFSRNYGYFKIFRILDDKLALIFDSSNSCDKEGVFVRNAEVDCYSFSPLLLNFHTEDVNEDGCVDFVFSGVQQNFCRGLERGIGRLDGPPVEETTVQIIFASAFSERSESWRWFLYNENICSILQR